MLLALYQGPCFYHSIIPVSPSQSRVATNKWRSYPPASDMEFRHQIQEYNRLADAGAAFLFVLFPSELHSRQAWQHNGLVIHEVKPWFEIRSP